MMKCPKCSHHVLEEKAKFCSQCGCGLSVQPAKAQDAKDQPKSLVSDSESVAERSVSKAVVPPANHRGTNRSPKRQSDDKTGHSKKNKKRQRRNKKKKGGSDSLDTAADESADSLQEDVSSLESQPRSLAANDPVVLSEDKQAAVGENSTSFIDTRGSVEAPEGQSPPAPTDDAVTPAAEQKMVFGPQKPSKADSIGSSVDPQEAGEPMEVQESGQSSDADKESQKDTEVDESADPLQGGLSSVESQSKSLAANTPVALSEDKQVAVSENRAATLDTRGSVEAPCEPNEGESDGPKPTQDQNIPAPTDDAVTQQSMPEDNKSTTLSDPDKKSNGTNNKDPKNGRNPKNKGDTAKTKQPPLDQNGNVEPNAKQTRQTRQKGKNEQGQQQKVTPAAEQNMVFGPQKPSKADSKGSSVHPEEAGEPMEVQGSAQSSDADRESHEDSQESNKSNIKRPVNNKDQKNDRNNSKNKEDTAKTKQPPLDQNVLPNAEQTRQTRQKGKNEQGQQQEVTPAAEQNMVFGPQKPSKADSKASSVHPEEAVEHMEVQGSAQSSDADRESHEDSQESNKSNIPPPKRPTSNKTISVDDRLTIYFHAVLSKDFKFNPLEDRIFITAGHIIGTWDDNAVELSVSSHLGEHGFLVQGSLPTSKRETESKSIPYKYVVYKEKKKEPEYEFLYKLDSKHHVNRCLFVKPHLLNSDGDWHQYDDIICAPQSKNVLDRITDMLWPQQKQNLIQGRQIAGTVMLDGIFDLLRSWTSVNLRNFWAQLKQFFEVYGDPFVFEEKQKKWHSLDYGKDDVRKMLKEFMLTKLIPQLQKKVGEGRMLYTEDPVRAAVIMLSVCYEYSIRLEDAECFRLCTQLCLPNLQKEDFIKYWTDWFQDVPFLRNLPARLLSLINAVKTVGNPNWFLALPLLHLLNGSTKPFEIQTQKTQKFGLSWAGLQGFSWSSTASSSMNSEQRRALVKLIKSKSHLIEVDPLLMRSCLYLIPFDELKECGVDLNVELLDILQVFLNRSPSEISSSTAQEASGILSHIHGKLIEEKYSLKLISLEIRKIHPLLLLLASHFRNRFTEGYRKSCLAIAVKLLEKLCSGVKPSSYTQNFPEIPVACMNVVASVSDFVYHNKQQETPEGETVKDYAKDMISQASNIMRKWLNQSFRQNWSTRSPIKTEEIEIWNNIISIHFHNEDCTKQWRQTFTLDFQGKYKQASAVDQIEFYCNNIEDLHKSHPYVAASIENCALEAVPSLCQSRSEAKLLERVQLNWFGKFGKLISAIIEKSWPKDRQGNHQEDEEAVLNHLLSWAAAKSILQLYAGEENLIEKLSKDATDRIHKAIATFKVITSQLVQGSIQISLLKIILKKSDAFLDLLQIDCLRESTHHKDKMKRLVQCRQDEMNAVYHEKELIDHFIAMSHKLEEHMAVDIAEMEERQQVNIEVHRLDVFMEVYLFDQMPSNKMGVVTYFKLDENTRKMAEVLHTFQESHLFKMCWEKEAKLLVADNMDADPDMEEIDTVATPEMIHDDIFEPSFDEYRKIHTCLKNGHITLAQVNELFGDYKGKYDELTQELEIMYRVEKSCDRQWIHARVQQIEQYHELHLAVASAEIIMMVKDTLCLQGDFRVLETLTETNHADFQKEQLNRIDNDLMQAKKVLVDITEPRGLCLRELGLRKNFVIWVKDALEDINELKVFVDLATISAGENDMDMDRVACFHDAVLGYSSMLYELKPDSGFNVFQEVLKKLWKALDNDCNIPKKLRDSARHLEWLKTVKDSHGSVELSSLSLASAINSKGIYLIGAPSEKRLSLDTVLRLQIPEEHDDGQRMRCYSLEDLRELQNKLMLMSGKGDQGQKEVDHFAEVFDHIQRLSKAYIALFTAGNPLFRHWNVQINCCSSSKEQSIVMDFNLENVAGVVLEGNVEELLPELCRKMEKCFDFWMNFVEEQRSQHYYLNYYTAEQIVYLCAHLAQQNVTNVDDHVLMMLSFVKPNCTASDLRQVRHALQYDILTKPEEQNGDIEFQTFVVPESDLEDLDSTSKLDPLTSLLESNSSQKLDLIWNAYRTDMKNFLPHILDMKSFGRLLKKLADKDTEEGISDHKMGNLIKRQLPEGLAQGNPNLIVCPHDEVLTSCVSVYMGSEEEPLPTYDEVLLCTSSTPYEQVELFLRRCLSEGYEGNKIYSLLYGDLLSYDVSSKVESFFQRMKMRSKEDYRLVIICTSEREHAYLPSAFSQYRLHMIPQRPLSRIQDYLHKHFVVPEDQCSAAAAFKDRLCVGVVSSARAGVGKSLYIKRLYEKLKDSTEKSSAIHCVRLIEPSIDESAILQSLLNTCKRKELLMFHFDITSSVQKGIHEFLFKLLILRYLMDSEGKMWKCSNKQLYLIEILEPAAKSTRTRSHPDRTVDNTFIDVFPNIFCRPPKEVLMLETRKKEHPTIVSDDDPLMDDKEFRNAAFQRPYQYLTRFYNHSDLDAFQYRGVEGSHVECLQMLLMYCGVTDPSWAELRNFAWFLNLQLQDCESSVFCDAAFTGDTLAGFKTFVVDFMILMAKDFATPSLSISDQSPGRVQMDMTGIREEDLAPFLLRKRWETQPHPYIFFNDDHVSMTFIGFHLQPNSQNFVDAIDPTTGTVIKKNVMTIALYEGLKLQRVPFNVDFDRLQRGEKIERICNVLGIQWPLDPDETYELTTDNILKMLAIHMRFRCGIPVIIMGETGCGKTRLIYFLCELRRGGVSTENMKLVKVHGGTTSDMIYTKVREAEDIASVNKQDGFDSVLFFDEANTTEAISSIKEVLCDKTVRGKKLKPDCGLQIIAACNPYRKHTDEMIQRLESAGLGYRVQAEETDEKLGSIPLRQLVYRVQALPPSMIPLVWDFGQLNDHSETIYIQQIVQRVAKNKTIGQRDITMITEVLSASQKYMRKRHDECSFVSLRDVERCMQSFGWFYDNHGRFFTELREYERKQNAENKAGNLRGTDYRDPAIWSLIMAIGVCYHACLENKDKYRQEVSKSLPPSYTPAVVMQEISLMQDLLLSGVPMGDTIAKNSALKENVFMMVLCIELRIPLFLVGKPGSSKSLSKTLVADAMQGQAAHSDLFKYLKQIHLVSFQCSPHSTPEGIINTFKQCGRFQEGKNLSEYISVVVLDEIGLAEDSPKMPLKTLHPLLEEGCIDDEPLPHKKVGFIGISNWALDPAKMNRGIFVSRGDPDERELIESAKGICSSDAMVLEKVRDFFQPLAKAYLNICGKQGKGFFGLRDYYSLIKMIFAVAKISKRKPSTEEIVKAVLRNFSGKDDMDTVSVFAETLKIEPHLENLNAIEFVRENIQAVGKEEECRYLLVLTKNYAALQILQQTFFSENGLPEIIFGSSFPKDQEYTQICRNINRVKICMETGRTVVLLNLQNLYESLYDALNQYYVYLGGQKYVDLGLGTHRVKCRVHKDFRLIVIEERDVVYKQFPIPLINRLEKHYLDIHTVLKTEQKRMVDELEKWVTLFVSSNSHSQNTAQTYKYKPADVFIGYHSDTCASVILQVMEKQRDNLENSELEGRILDEAKLTLLECATPDSIVRLDCSGLPKVESENLARVYHEKQSSNCLTDFIVSQTKQEVHCYSTFTEVTTFSRLLTASDIEPLEKMMHSVELLSLQQFDTEHSFLKKIRNFFTAGDGSPGMGTCDKVLIIQSDFDEASQSANLIASAKYSSINEINKISQQNTEMKVFVYFITRLPRMEGGTSYVGFHGGPWRAAHIDDLRQSKDIVSDIKVLQNMTISQMFETQNSEPEAMEVDDMYTENDPKEADVEENGCHQVVDTTALVRSCVQIAVGMLRDQVESGVRSTRRVEILLTLLGDSDEIKGEFLQTVKKHLHLLLSAHDSNTFTSDRSNWVIKEASNFDALQEGGTFRHTLWKRVQAAVVPLLAHLVSVIDRDQNLDLLLDSNCSQSVKRLWLDIFGNDKLLEILHPQADHNSDTRTILVQNYIVQDRSMRCCMPFSWRIKNYLEELWVHALHHEDRTQKEFDEFFWNTPLGRYIKKTDLEMQTEFFQRYLQDFICMTMNVTCQEDLQLLCGALSCCVSELRVQLSAMDTVISLPWIHAAYNKFKNRLQNLSRMICIEPQVIQHLLKNHHSRSGDEMVLDVYAAFACVEYLEPSNLATVVERQAWLGLVKKLQVPIELICSEDSVKHYGERSKALVCRVQTGWNRISLLALFVENILLGTEEVDERLTPLVLEHTKRLAQILERNSDVKSHQAFEEVITLLKSCKDAAVEHIFRFGMSLCPVCMGDPQDPLSLPCEHIYCLACLKEWLRPGQMYCPLCIQEVDDNFPLVPSEDLRISLNQHAQFRKQCNAFFIDLVSSMCFKDNSPPSPTIIVHLLSLLMVEVTSAPIFKKRAGEQQILTKMLSPFDDSVDKNPVVRSVVLKLLLKYSFDEVKDYLQQHLLAIEQSNILEKTDKTELCLLYINCLEDSMYERFQFRTTAEQQVFLQEESAFLYAYQLSQSDEATTVEYLQHVARVRMDLDMAACLIVERLKHTAERTDNSQNRTTAFLDSVVNLCRRSENDWYRVYLIRKISSQHGVEFVLKLLNEDAVRWLFPLEVLQKSQEVAPIDQYLVCGEHYKTIRNAVAKVVLEGQIEGLDKTCEECGCSPQQRIVYLLLALNREVTTLYRDVNANFHPKPELVQTLVTYIEGSKFLTNPLVKAFAQALVKNQLGPLVVRPGASGADCVLVDLTIHLAAVLLCGGQGILAPLQQLAMQPANMQRAFLPTMADDMLAAAQQVLGPLQWYHCPNGHPCAIGECGQPMEKSHCVDCNAEIGGVDHRPVKSFQAVQLQGDRTRTGHILGDPNRRDNADMLDTKGISPVPFTTIRMFTHMAMLLGAGSHLQFISRIIQPQVADPGPFLLAHLQKDLKHLIRSLGKGTDDTVSAVHLLIRSLLEQRGGLGDNLLSTKEARNRWETEVSNTVITPQLKHLDRQLKEVNAFIRADSRISANPVVKLLFGDPRLFLASLPQTSLIHSTSVWSCREKVSLLSLTHYVEQNDGKDNLPVLWRFLHKEAELRLVKHLPDILTLQRDLVKNFQNVTELTCGTIGDFLRSQKTDSLKHRYHEYIKLFLTTWNQLRVSLMTNGEIKISAEYCQKDMDLNSDFMVLLPQRQGPGLCSTALVGYLIALHNDLVYCTDKHTGEETSYKVSPCDLTDLHVIRYELERDLMPLVLANTQYSIEKGQETLHEYDLPKIQQQIVARFLLGKPLITLNGIPTLVNRRDRNYEIILRDIKAKVPQEPLQTLILSDVAGELHSYSEVCDALSTLEVALGFLAMTGGEPHMQLSSYLEEVLQMGNQMAPHILKTLSICRLKHCVALWQLLASLKSENMLRLKRDPFVGVSHVYKEALGEEEQRLLTGFFSKNSADGFLLEIHEFLVLVLKKADAPDTFKPDWGLKETLEGYMERKNLDVPQDVDMFFPEEILLSHCVEAWKFIVAFKQERHRH